MNGLQPSISQFEFLGSLKADGVSESGGYSSSSDAESSPDANHSPDEGPVQAFGGISGIGAFVGSFLSAGTDKKEEPAIPSPSPPPSRSPVRSPSPPSPETCQTRKIKRRRRYTEKPKLSPPKKKAYVSRGYYQQQWGQNRGGRNGAGTSHSRHTRVSSRSTSRPKRQTPSHLSPPPVLHAADGKSTAPKLKGIDEDFWDMFDDEWDESGKTVESKEPTPEVTPLDPKNQAWTDLFRPKKAVDVVGNRRNIGLLQKWVQSRVRNDPKCKNLIVLLHGRPGLGKTTVSHAVLREAGYKVHEINASIGVRTWHERLYDVGDTHEKYVRSTDAFYVELQEVITRDTLDGVKAVVLDEIDGGGTDDSGAVQGVLKLLKEADAYREKYKVWPQWPPIICIANEAHSKPMQKLKDRALELRFYPLYAADLSKYGRRICKFKNIRLQDQDFVKLINKADGDARRFTYLLEAFSLQGRNIEEFLAASEKDDNANIFDATTHILYNKHNSLADNNRYYQMEQDLMELMVQHNGPSLFNYGWISGESKKAQQTQMDGLDDLSTFLDTYSTIDFIDGSLPMDGKLQVGGTLAGLGVAAVMGTRKRRHHLVNSRPRITFTDFFTQRNEIEKSRNLASHLKGSALGLTVNTTEGMLDYCYGLGLMYCDPENMHDHTGVSLQTCEQVFTLIGRGAKPENKPKFKPHSSTTSTPLKKQVKRK